MKEIIVFFWLSFAAEFAVAQSVGRLSAFQALDDMRRISSNSVSAIREAMASAIPGQTYPILSSIPQTAFSCSQVQQAGYYADPDAGCQVFRQCLPDGSARSFICANQTLFNQISLVCDWWYNVDCSKASGYYAYSNPRIYQQNLRFLDDFGNGGVQPSTSPALSNEPPPAVAFALPNPGSTPTPQRVATARFNANRPIGRSLTSPTLWNINGNFFGNMNGLPTALPFEYTDQMNLDEKQIEQVEAEENQSLIDAGNLTIDPAENAQVTDKIDEHEIGDVTDHRNFRPAVQLNPAFNNRHTSIRPDTNHQQSPNAADSVPSGPTIGTSSIKNRVMTVSKNQAVIEFNPSPTKNTSQPDTTALSSMAPGISTAPTINSSQFTGKNTEVNVIQPNTAMVQLLVSSTVKSTQPTTNPTAMVQLNKGTLRSVQPTTKSATMVQLVKGTANLIPPTTYPTTMVSPIKGTMSLIQVTTSPTTPSKTSTEPTTRVTVFLRNSDQNPFFNTSTAPSTVVRVRKDVLPAQTTTPADQSGTETGLYKQIPTPNLNQQRTPVMGAERDFYGMNRSPSISLLLTLKRFVTSTNDLLARRLQ